MEPARKLIYLDLDRDAAELIALWLAIHGGDPAPDREPVEVSPATALLATAMVAQLRTEFRPRSEPLPDKELARRLDRLNLDLRLSNGLCCVQGPEGEPGCCVRLASFRPQLG